MQAGIQRMIATCAVRTGTQTDLLLEGSHCVCEVILAAALRSVEHLCYQDLSREKGKEKHICVSELRAQTPMCTYTHAE